MNTPPGFQRELQVCRELARGAGELILAHYAAGVSVDYKDKRETDPVTIADREANALIVEGLQSAFPDDGILAEESPDSERRLGCSRLWCVDPLDGTRDFIDRTDEFVVMIGLAIDGRARFGVVFQPTKDRLYWGGANVAMVEHAGQSEELKPSQCDQPTQAVMVVSRSHRSEEVTAIAQTLGVEREIPVGSVGLKVAEVARGRAQAYISLTNRTKEWDACAPEAILRAAGGEMTDITGAALQYNKPTTETPHGMLATNEHLHSAFVDALKPATSKRGW